VSLSRYGAQSSKQSLAALALAVHSGKWPKPVADAAHIPGLQAMHVSDVAQQSARAAISVEHVPLPRFRQSA
jgi:hypothetical protein